jgi:2'-5' RNA ligase
MPTIGVAIGIPEPYGSMLRAKRAEFGDPMAETVPSHVTLIPPTFIDDDALDSVVDALDRTASGMPAFTMGLRGTGTFRPISPVVFVAVSQGISYTELLAQAVQEALSCPEPEFPFHPHVTVAHHLDDASLDRAYDDLSDFSCDFTVSQFALYFHTDDEGWVPQRSFVLRSQ